MAVIGEQINLGNVSINPKGTYDSTVSYSKLDVVYYEQNSYICLKPNKGFKPDTNTEYWSLLAVKGKGIKDNGLKIKSDTAEKVTFELDYNDGTKQEFEIDRTTLTDVYTKGQVNGIVQDLQDEISAITSFSYEVVDELPTTGENGKIYMVEHDDPGEQDYFDEYIWLSTLNRYEHIGSTKIDLSNYFTKDEVLALIKENSAKLTTKSLTPYITDSANSKVKDIVVSGDIRQDTREGYNEIPYPYEDTTKTISGVTFTDNGNGTIKVNGTATADIVFNIVHNYTFENGTTYYISGCPSGGSSSNYSWVISGLVRDTGTPKTFTGTSGTKNITIEIKNGTTCNNLVFSPMVVKGNTQKPYEPYGASPSIDYPSEVNYVNGNYDIVVSNKNLFDKNKVINGKAISSTNGTLYDATDYSVSDYILVNKGTYIKSNSHRYAIYDLNKTFVESKTDNTFTLTNNSYVRLQMSTANIGNVQLEQGSTATPYEEHKEQVLQLDSSSYPLYNTTDYYYKDNGKWYVHNEYAKGNVASGVTSVTYSDMLSNGNFKSYFGGTLSNKTITFSGTTTTSGYVIYQLETPTNTEITSTTLINELEELSHFSTYKGGTHITYEDIHLSGKYVVDSTLVDSIEEYNEINEITDKEYIDNAIDSVRNVYSSEETICGTYMGKPLYRKCYEKLVGAFTANTSFDLITNLETTIDKVFISGSYISNYEEVPLNYYLSTSDNSRVWVNKTSHSIRVKSGATALSNYTACIILEYTKTTD